MKDKILKNKKAFTLIEIIIYLAILGMIVVSFISFSLAISNVKNKVYVTQAVNSNLRQALDMISLKTKEAEDIILPTVSNTESQLRLERVGTEPDWIFFLIDGVLYLDTDIAEPIAVTSEEVEITDLIFKNLSKKNNRNSLRVYIEGRYRQADSLEFEYEHNLQTTITTRK